MRILFFASVDFYQKPNPSFHLMNSLIEDILTEGHQIIYVGPKLKGIEKHVPDSFKKCKRFRAFLIDYPNTEKKRFAKRYFDGVLYALKATRIIRKIKDDFAVAFVQSSPTVLYNVLALRLFSHEKRIIYNVQDMFPGSSIASGVMSKKWMQILFYKLQRIAYRKSNVIVAISEDMKTKLIEQGVPEGKISVIVNWFDDSQLHEVLWEDNSFVKEYEMSRDAFYVQYAGTMGYVFDYNMVITVAGKLKKETNIVFQMIGEGSQKECFVQEVKKRNLTNVHFLPLQPQERVSEVYSACSACLIPLKKGIIGNSVPSKAGLLMACRRPIISSVDRGSDFAKMINEHHIGIAVDNADPEAVCDAIMKLFMNRDIANEMGNNGYNFGHNLYSRSYNTKKYIDLLTQS